MHPVFFFFINLFFIYFYFWLHWVFVAARGPPLAAASGDHFIVVHGPLNAVSCLVADHGL